MLLQDFKEWIDELENVTGISIGKEGFKVIHPKSGSKSLIPLETVESLDESKLSDVEEYLRGERDESVLRHMTRVVGYYSLVENWNPSKIGELKDRHKGDYVLATA